MDEKKNQGQGNQGRSHQSQKQHRAPEGGRGSQGERNSSSFGGGISNRGMDSEEEQEGVPDRGSARDSSDQSDQSER